MANRLLNPMTEMDALGRFLDERWDPFLLNPFSVQVSQFPIDVYESMDEFLVQASLPGVPHDRVEVTLEGSQLLIRAERPQTGHEGFTRLHTESPHGTFYRSVTLSQGIQHDRIEAAWKDGVLLVRIPKLEQARAKRIPIRVESDAQPQKIAEHRTE